MEAALADTVFSWGNIIKNNAADYCKNR